MPWPAEGGASALAPAQAPGAADHRWTLAEIAGLLDQGQELRRPLRVGVLVVGVFPTTTGWWIGLGGWLVVALVVRSIKHRGWALAAGLAVVFTSGLVAYLVTASDHDSHTFRVRLTHYRESVRSGTETLKQWL